MHRYLGNLYDRQTLVDQLQQAETLSEVAAKTVAVDPGYRGWHANDAHIIYRRKKLSKREKKRLRRPSVIEAMIGHMKNEGLLSRSHSQGLGRRRQPCYLVWSWS